MADNVAVTAGTGTAIAADEVVDGTLGTVKVQYVKLMDGTIDGTAKSTIKAASTGPATTDTGLVVHIHPLSQTTPGQAAVANSLPVAIGTEQTFIGQNQASASKQSLLIGGQFNTTPTTITSGNLSPLQLDAAGNLKVNTVVAQASTTSGQSGTLSQGAVTTAAPTYTTGQTSPLSLDTTGALRVSGAFSTGLTQGSTTSGQSGDLIQGAVTTAAPTYTTGQTNPLSLTVTGALRVDGSAQTQPVSVATQAQSASVSFTCGTTAYAALDCVGASGANAALDFTSMGPSGKEILITSAALEIDATAIISGETSYTLHLYNVTPPSAINDSSPFTLGATDRAAYLGFINIGTPAVLGVTTSTLYCEVNGLNKQVKLSGTDLFGYLISNGAYTPTARVFKVTLHTLSV